MLVYKNLKTKTKVGLGVAAPLILTVIIGAIAIYSVRGINHTAHWVDHTRVVLSKAAEIVGAAVDMETGMRGFMLAGREEFLEPYVSGEERAYALIAELQQTVSDNPAQVALLGEVETVLRQWQTDVAEVQIAMRRQVGSSATMDDVAELIGQARGKTYFDGFRQLMADFAAEERRLMEIRQASKDSQEFFAFWSIMGGLLAAMVVGVVAALKIGGSIATPLSRTTHAMNRLIEGDTSVEIVGADRKDEVGEIAKATQVFRENAIRVQQLAEAEKAEHAAASERQFAMATLQSAIAQVVESASRGEFSDRIATDFEDPELQKLAQGVNGLLKVVDDGVTETARVVNLMAAGDLRQRMQGEFQGAFAELQSNVNDTVDRLAVLVREIVATTVDVGEDATSINDSARTLAARATEQASTLEQTAATMEEMSASVTLNA